MRTLIGIGVGPGDPELLTLKAARLLREADVVFAPTTSLDRESRAEQIVLEATGIRAQRLVFALEDQGGVTPERAAAWDAAARTVIAAFNAGAETVAFATLGDPNVYSTFGYLAQTITALDDAERDVNADRHPHAAPSPDNVHAAHGAVDGMDDARNVDAARGAHSVVDRVDGVDGVRDVRIESVPGITAMQDLAARADVRLAEGREPLTLVPATAGLDEVRRALDGDGTVVVYKGGRFLGSLMGIVEQSSRGIGAVLGTDLGLATERIRTLDGWAAQGERAPYFTTLIIPPVRGGRGEAL